MELIPAGSHRGKLTENTCFIAGCLSKLIHARDCQRKNATVLTKEELY